MPQGSPQTQDKQISTPLLFALALLGAVAPLATDMYLPTFPSIAEDFAASDTQVQLTLTAFMMGASVGQLFWGPISDRFGRYRPVLIAAVLLVVVSAAAPLSPGIAWLIAFRFLQGFTGAAGKVISRAIARDLSTGVTLARVFSLLAVITGLAPVIAPVIGGLLADTVGWRGILWVLAGISVIMLGGVLTVVPESLPPERRTPAGLGQVGRSVVTVLSDRAFVGYTLVLMFGFGALFAYISGSSFVLQVQYGLSAQQYAAAFAFNASAMIIGGALNGRLVGRFSPQSLLRAAVILTASATAVLLALVAILGQPPLLLMLVLIMVGSIAASPILANTTTLGLSRHGRNAGMAAAVMGAGQMAFGGAVSPAVAIGGEATVGSMAIVMAACGALCAVSFFALCRGGDVLVEPSELPHGGAPDAAVPEVPAPDAAPQASDDVAIRSSTSKNAP